MTTPMGAPDAPPPPPTRRPRGLLAVLVTLGVLGVAAIVAALVLVGGGSSPAPQAAASTPSPRPVQTTDPAAPTPTAAPKPAVPHEFVPKSWPTRFTFAGRGYTINAHVCAMPDIVPFDPPGEQHHTVCYPETGFGTQPGSNSQTTYIFGHSWGQNDLEVLNRVSSRATKEILAGTPTHVNGIPIWPVHVLTGSMVILHTGTGTLTYKVRDAYGVAKDQAGYVKSLMNQRTPNRVVILTCAERNHVDYDYNVIVEAYLYSSSRAAV